MAKANLFNREVRANKSPRNAFNMSYSTLFSSPCGLLQPTYVQEVKKGDKLKLGLSNVTRTRPLQTSAFMSFDEKVDFWYVPYYLLWSPYDEWRLRQSYPHSSLSLLEAGKQNLLPHTNYNSLLLFLKTSLNIPYNLSNSIPTLAGYHYYNLNSVLRYLDLLGYGIPNNVDYSNLHGTFLVPSNTTDHPQDKLFIENYKSYLKQFSTSGIFINYFRLAAFQCIYMHHYRNEEYEKLDPTCYNMDSLFADGYADNLPAGPEQTNSSPQYLHPTSSVTPPSNISRHLISWEKVLQPRYKNWRKDVFTSAKPNSGFSSVSGLSPLQDQNGTDFYWPTSVSVNIDVASGSSSSITTGRFPSSTAETAFNIDSSNASVPFVNLAGSVLDDKSRTISFLYPQQIYNLMAQDKFLRSAVYADKNLSAQMKALFGDDYNDSHCPSYLGSFSTTVNISDVTATATGNDGDTADLSSSLLGEIAGKGYNSAGKNSIFSRKFDYDGVVIGVHYLMPRNNYDSARLNLFNTKVSAYDYFYPQFDGLGMQPIYMFERNYYIQPSSVVPPTTLFGYGPRFHEYKQRTNEVHSCFQSNQSDSDWTLSNNQFNVATASNFANFKILPTITDRLFTLNWDSSFASDPFMCYFYYDATLISDMEVYGTPSI